MYPAYYPYRTLGISTMSKVGAGVDFELPSNSLTVECRNPQLQVYANTLNFILSKSDPYYHVGHSKGMEFSGIGSPHTSHIPNSIWPMAMIMEGLVSRNATRKIQLVNQVLASSAETGWMHESFDPNNPKKFSR